MARTENIKSTKEEGSTKPQGDQSLTGSQEDQPMDSSDESDLEDLSTRNKDHRPYRDVTCNNNEDSNSDDDDVNTSPSPAGTSTIAAADVRKRVKKTVGKKHRAMRRTKRGEAGVVTRARRENRDTVKQSVGAFDGW